MDSIQITRSLEKGLRSSPPPGVTAQELVRFFDTSRLSIEEMVEAAILNLRPFQVEVRLDSFPYLIASAFSDPDEADLFGTKASGRLKRHFHTTNISYRVVPSVLLHRSENSWDRDGALSHWIEYEVGGIWITDGYCQSFSVVDDVRREFDTYFNSSASLVHGSSNRPGARYFYDGQTSPFKRFFRYSIAVDGRVHRIGQDTYELSQNPAKLHQLSREHVEEGPYTIIEHEGHFDQHHHWIDRSSRKL